MSIIKEEERAQLIETLEALYPEAQCELVHENPFQLLVSVVLSAQTTDQSVNLVTPALFAKYPDAQSIATMDLTELEQQLKRIGMYKTKAKHVKALCELLVREYQGKVPADYDHLVALPGVGRKTANVVLSVAFGEQRIAVDTHVFRLANRIGFVAEKDVLKTELALMESIPKAHWTSMHHALIWHGRRVCHARRPNCTGCGIASFCQRNGLEKELP